MVLRKRIIAVGAVALIAAAAVSTWVFTPENPRTLEEVKFQLTWTHSASYAGFYFADRNGDYAKEGLRVEFLVGGPKIRAIEQVISGKAQIGLANGAELVRARSAGQPLKAIACVYRKSPLVYITLEGSGIDHPSKFGNKVIRASRQNTIVLKSVISKYDVDFDTIKVVSSNDINQLINGEIDIWSGYSSVSLARLAEQGIKTNVMHPDNFGAHFYYSCIFTTDKFIDEKPDIVLSFLRASLQQGWPRAFRNPDEAAALVRSYGPKLNIENEAKAISIMLPLVDTGAGHIGAMEPEVWDSMANEMRQQNLLESPVDARAVFDGRFLERIYGANGDAS